MIYCVLDHEYPCLVIDDRRAYWFDDGRWKEMHVADTVYNAGVIGKAAFDERFGPLPKPPR